MANQTVRVAILGGGIAGVAAAWELVTNPPSGVTYDVTIYEANWRLGGKCASGRNVALGGRIEEHGIHILMGFYSQIFRMLRDGYATLPPSLGFPKLLDALVPGDYLQLPDQVNGAWTFWPLTFPTNDRVPGDADPDVRDIPTALLRAARIIAGWRTEYEKAIASKRSLGQLLHDCTKVLGTCAVVVEHVVEAGPDLVAHLESLLAEPPPDENISLELRHLWMAIYFGAANLRGILRDQLFTPESFRGDAINALDYKEWLKGVGGEFPSPALTWDSPIVNAVYDLVFSRAAGFAAGAALYDILLMLLDYAGHVFYRMAGTGDVVFGPMYFALKQKNVSFRFEHTVTGVTIAPGASGEPEIQTITVVGDGKERTRAEIFIDVDGQPCWPSQSLVNRPTAPITLTRSDFDYVVSAIPIGALKESVPAIAALPPVANAIATIKTIPTESIQLWFDKTVADMGWTYDEMMLGSFARPFNSCGDMRQVLPQEHYGNEKSVLYLSDVFDGDTTDPNVADPIVRARAITWIETELPTLLPAFTWDRLVDPAGALGSHRFQSQYWRGNVTGTELYVASAPGTVKARLPAGGAGVANLVLASDWVQTEENQGCVEGGCRSGVSAAAQLSAWVGVPASTKKSPATPLPAYVQRDGDWVFPHPVRLTGAKAKAYPLLADPAALAALCKEVSIDGVTIRPWLPAVPLVLLYTCASDAITSTDPAYADYGALAEREVGFFVPVVVDKGGVSFVAVMAPYMYVDNAAALLAGRETYGIPKELATFSAWSFDAPPPVPLDVTSLTLANKGDLARERIILQLTPNLSAMANAASQGSLKATLEHLWKELTTGSIEVPLVMLKQFHAVENGTGACYQQIVRCGIEPSNIDTSIEFQITEATFPDYFFPKIAKTMGLAASSVSLLTITASLDFVLTLGTVV